MYQIDVTTAASSLPTPAAAGTPGYFTDGDPGTGTPATIVPADFLNAVQEELLNLLSSAGITPSKTDRTQVLAAIKAVTTGRLLNVQTFTSSGTYTPTPGTTSIVVDGVAPGGSGGACAATTSATCAAAAGGGAGAYVKARFTSGFSGGVTVTIGAPGAAPAAGNNNGNTGGTSSFGTLLTLPGGTSGNGSPAFTPPGGGGSNGGGSSAPTGANIVGFAGQAGGNGLAFTINTPQAGAGGSGPLGSGGWAPTGNGARSGSGYGVGSSGANAQASSAAQAGLAGQPGIFIVYEYA